LVLKKKYLMLLFPKKRRLKSKAGKERFLKKKFIRDMFWLK